VRLSIIDAAIGCPPHCGKHDRRFVSGNGKRAALASAACGGLFRTRSDLSRRVPIYKVTELSPDDSSKYWRSSSGGSTRGGPCLFEPGVENSGIPTFFYGIGIRRIGLHAETLA